MTVGKLSTRAQTLFSIREFIQERNPTNVMNVGSPSGGTLICATSSEKPYECNECGKAFSQSSLSKSASENSQWREPCYIQRMWQTYRWSSELIRYQRVRARKEPSRCTLIEFYFCLINFRTRFHKTYKLLKVFPVTYLIYENCLPSPTHRSSLHVLLLRWLCQLGYLWL